MGIALAVILALVFLAAILLEKTLRGVPTRELRRQARENQNHKALSVYKLSAFGRSSELFLWLVGGFSAAGLILMTTNYSWWLGLIVAVVAILLAWAARPRPAAEGWLFGITSVTSSLLLPVVSTLQPILVRLARVLKPSPHPPTGVYEKDDLLEFLKMQARHPYNRIATQDLKTAHSALSFNGKNVGSIMIPRRKVKWVAANEVIGPMLMDELHKTGQTRFAVVKEAIKTGNPQIVGTLYLKDLLENLDEKGRIRDLMYPGAHFINESQNLREALEGFLKAGQYLLVVTNNFEEIVGVLSFEDVLEQIIGERLAGELEYHDDIHSIAAHNTATENVTFKPDRASEPENHKS